MSIEVEKFLKVLEKIDTLTPKTAEFDREYGQFNGRWWDKVGDDCKYFSKQKYHIYLYFFCRACHNGSINKKCDKKCKECYKNELDRFTNKDVSKSKLKDNFLQTKYNSMGRPEMYLWFVEAFGFLNGKDLKQCFEKAAEICHPDKNNYAAVRDMIKNYYHITWDEIADRANEIAGEMGIE